jgi:hypothetical protein
MLKPLDPFLFLLIAIAGCMSQRQVQVIVHLALPCTSRDILRGARSPAQQGSGDRINSDKPPRPISGI